MATYTAGEQINRALRLLGVLAEGETPSADMSNDALTALDQMIDSWNTERLKSGFYFSFKRDFYLEPKFIESVSVLFLDYSSLATLKIFLICY